MMVALARASGRQRQADDDHQMTIAAASTVEKMRRPFVTASSDGYAPASALHRCGCVILRNPAAGYERAPACV